ncbi:unnamed protein product [Sphagnum compactum]
MPKSSEWSSRNQSSLKANSRLLVLSAAAHIHLVWCIIVLLMFQHWASSTSAARPSHQLVGLQFVESAAYAETLKAARAIDQDAVSFPPSSLKILERHWIRPLATESAGDESFILKLLSTHMCCQGNMQGTPAEANSVQSLIRSFIKRSRICTGTRKTSAFEELPGCSYSRRNDFNRRRKLRSKNATTAPPITAEAMDDMESVDDMESDYSDPQTHPPKGN